MKVISTDQIQSTYLTYKAKGLINESDTAVIFYAKEILLDKLNLLSHAFPENTLHSVAIKSNSCPEVLRTIAEHGYGLEAASYEEVLLAKKAGVPFNKIVFDSPVKTIQEIQNCHLYFPGIILNANSLEELVRYPSNFSGELGLRINPLVDADAPDLFNVSTKTSKFGVPISQHIEIIKACLQYKQIVGLHMHIGSGIHNYNANLLAIQKMIVLADTINEERKRANIDNLIHFIDIGGGIDFSSDNEAFNMDHFVHKIKQTTHLFDKYKVITEYGKFIHNDAAFVVSDIEYIVDGINSSVPKTAFIHVGADLFLRKVYSNLPIEYPYSIIKSENSKTNKVSNYNIAGPLCFNGDYLYYDIQLPELCENDKFVIQNVGANTLSMWSQHCSRKIPKFIFINEL